MVDLFPPPNKFSVSLNGFKIKYSLQRLTLTFQIKESLGLVTFQIKESE